jgi:hypothetical protein
LTGRTYLLSHLLSEIEPFQRYWQLNECLLWNVNVAQYAQVSSASHLFNVFGWDNLTHLAHRIGQRF